MSVNQITWFIINKNSNKNIENWNAALFLSDADKSRYLFFKLRWLKMNRKKSTVLLDLAKNTNFTWRQHFT